MRTKALLCAAALAAGAVTSMAQSNVYSLNVVGYYNVTLKPGFNLVANQLTTGTNGLGQVLPATAEVASMVMKYKNNNYNVDVWDGTSWLDNVTGAASATTVAPGEGFFFFNAGSANLQATFVGEVKQGTGLTVPLPAGFSLVSSIVPQAIDLTSANSFPQVLTMLYMTYDTASSSYTTLINDGTQWLDNVTGNPAMATPQVGQGFFIFNPDAGNHDWVRNFTVQ